MPFDLAVIDLDNTLYAADSGVFARMDKRMTAFVANELNVSHDEADRLRVQYWKKYGTTLACLPGRKVIHTNGIREHAERILITLGIAHHFERNNGAGTGTVDVIGEAFITQ